MSELPRRAHVAYGTVYRLQRVGDFPETMLVVTPKNWDAHVVHAEEVARGSAFRHLRDRIVELAEPTAGETAVDVGAGTGLLTLALAQRGVQVWAVDISPAMGDYLRAKAASAGSGTVDTVVGSAVSLPLVDGCADLVVSNYCFHHLSQADKRRALAEAHRVLRPGGRLVFGDMMFALGLRQARDRKVVGEKVAAMLRKGPAGVARLARNGVRVLSGRWERPARAGWWAAALHEAGFVDVTVEELSHEGGLSFACRP
jgi:ubiquinone/menaquinone biosynthesis C-methylase UbiE